MSLQTPTRPTTNPDGSPKQHGFITVARAEAYWIEKARKDPLAFIYYVTGKKPAPHHVEWVKAVLSGKLVNIIAFRESGKTTILVSLLAWLIAKDPLQTHFIGSVSAGQAEARLEMVRELINSNVRFQNVFPWIHIDARKTTNKSEFTVWSSKDGLDYAGYRTQVSLKGNLINPTLCAFGVGSSQVIGKRISGLALIDDIHSEANSATPALRQKVEDWFLRTFLPLLTETGRIAVICTRWAPDDMSGRLKDKKDYLGEYLWKTLETAVVDAEGNPTWPGQWTLERIQLTKDKVGPVMYELMYLNNPLGMSASMFKIEMLRRGLPDPLPELSSIVISTDLALLEKSSSDYTVFAAIGKSASSKYYDMFLLDLLRERISSEKVIDALLEFCDRVASEYHNIEWVLFENQSLTLSSFNEFRAKESMYKPKLVTLKGDKGARLFGVSLKAQRGGFYLNQNIEALPALQSEFLGFPKTEHDDIIDAVSLPLQHWGYTERESGIVQLQSPFML